MEEGGIGRESKDNLRNAWRKLIESEERLRFWKNMVGIELGVREIENLGENIKEKFRSEAIKEGKCEREVIKLIMRMKLKDERKHQRELKRRREIRRTEL